MTPMSRRALCDGLHGKAHHQDGTGPAAPHGVNSAGAQLKQPFSGRQGPVGHMELALRRESMKEVGSPISTGSPKIVSQAPPAE